MESTLTLEPVSPRERWTPIELMRDFNNVRHLVPKSPAYAPTIETPIGRRLMDRYLEDSISLSSYGGEYVLSSKEDEVRPPEVPSVTEKLVESLGNGPTSGPRATAMGILTLSTFLRSLSISQMHKVF